MKEGTSSAAGRCPLRSPWILGLFILGIATVALSDERTLEGSRQTATVLSAGGQRMMGGRLVGTTVLGEALVGPLELRGGNYVVRAGFVAKKKLLGQPTTSVDDAAGSPVAVSRLVGNQPNPFNPSTAVHFDLARQGVATFRIYDVHGRLVRRLGEGLFDAGRHELTWDGRSEAGQPMASGVYLLEMIAGDYRGQHKMILAR